LAFKKARNCASTSGSVDAMKFFTVISAQTGRNSTVPVEKGVFLQKNFVANCNHEPRALLAAQVTG
jgi:hypothetical protein